MEWSETTEVAWITSKTKFPSFYNVTKQERRMLYIKSLSGPEIFKIILDSIRVGMFFPKTKVAGS